ncbi:hypothetical protein [Paraburkholderia caffeinilytica]|uniref:hypothetical protein n=1 Tax=Paraburkholderia caffeinilytica TaxID=1761016 RepID=UPI003DA1BFB6
MKNLNKVVALVLCLFFAQFAWGSEGIIFDNQALVVVNANGVLTGYYDAEDDKRSCSFLFVQVGNEVKQHAQSPYSEVRILTFVSRVSDFTFAGRDRSFDIDGVLYKRDATWLIRTDVGQAGCENALGAFVSYPRDKVGGEIFAVQKRIPATGIRLANRKSFFYDLRAGEFVARKGYLSKRDGVIVLQTRDQFSYVRFADPRVNVANPGRVTTGWVRTADLVNPFPPPNTH